MKLNWYRNGHQHVATGKQAEYRIAEWGIGGGSTFALDIKQFSTSEVTGGGLYPTLQRAKEVAYSLDIR